MLEEGVSCQHNEDIWRIDRTKVICLANVARNFTPTRAIDVSWSVSEHGRKRGKWKCSHWTLLRHGVYFLHAV